MPEEFITELPTVRRMPTCPETHRESIHVFLTHLRDKLDVSLNNWRVASMTDRSQRTLGSLAYNRQQVAILNWLISLNARRRKAPTDSGPRPGLTQP